MDEYLRKHYGDASAKGREKKKKRKKKREGNLQVLDDEDVVRVGIWKAGEDSGEDLPTVVEEVPEETRRERGAGKRSFAGSWVQSDEVRVKSATGDSHSRTVPSSEDVLSQGRHREEDASPPRRGVKDEEPSPSRMEPLGEDASPPRRRRPEEGIEENVSSPRRGGPDVDASPPRRIPLVEDASPLRRGRREKDVHEDISRPSRRGLDEDASPPRRGPVEEDASPPRRRRREEDASPPRRRRQEEEDSSPRRRWSDADAAPPRRPKDTSKRVEAKKMSSGLSAGLLKGEDLSRQSRALKEERERMLATARADDIGRGAETVYRDHTGIAPFQESIPTSFPSLTICTLHTPGKKISKAEGSAGKSAPSRDEGRRVVIDGEERILGKGGLQGGQESDPIIVHASELSSKSSSQAAAPGGNQSSGGRTRPTWGVATVPESERVRWGDPMANLVKTASSGSSRSKFAAPPNRFNIAPGPRWDGKDRSNGFENKLINAEGSRREKEQISYEWSVENM